MRMLALAHIPLERGGARVGGWPRLGRAGTMGGEDGSGHGRGEINLPSTVDAVDDGFKLRSHAQSPSSILTRVSPIRKIKS